MEYKETFDTVANEYEKYRPTYPDELFKDIFEYSKVSNQDKILEIGCGTGQATIGLIQSGYYNVTCIELGANLARITSEKFKDYETVKVINSSFEDWNPEDEYQLVISGTAFHFIEPNYGYRKVWELLSSKGSIAFFWTIHVPIFDDLYSEIREHYKSFAPHLDDSKFPSPDEVILERKKITEQTALFSNIVVKEYKWFQQYSSKDYVSLLNTNSKHRQLDDNQRKKLFDGIGQTIDRYGGYINKKQMVALFLASK